MEDVNLFKKNNYCARTSTFIYIFIEAAGSFYKFDPDKPVHHKYVLKLMGKFSETGSPDLLLMKLLLCCHGKYLICLKRITSFLYNTCYSVQFAIFYMPLLIGITADTGAMLILS